MKGHPHYAPVKLVLLILLMFAAAVVLVCGILLLGLHYIFGCSWPTLVPDPVVCAAILPVWRYRVIKNTAPGQTFPFKILFTKGGYYHSHIDVSDVAYPSFAAAISDSDFFQVEPEKRVFLPSRL